jgi:lipoprotein NlpI
MSEICKQCKRVVAAMKQVILCTFVIGTLMSTTRWAACDDKAKSLIEQALESAERGDSKQAVKFLDRAIESDPKLATAYYWRGSEHFRLGNVKESVDDFDRFVQLNPAAEREQWKRGISYYYAKEYEKGAKQFELYQTYHDNDVENSTWRFLCVAKKDGVEKARKTLLPIKNDRRVPMMQIYAMYRGDMSPEDVLKSARQGDPDEEELNRSLFYAHLYVGLYFEALGKEQLAAEHIRKAADKHRIGHYMWDVARVHAEQFKSKPATK